MRLFKHYKSIVYVSNAYALLQYLLLTDNKTEETLFIFHPSFGKDMKGIYEQFPVHPFFRYEQNMVYQKQYRKQAFFLRFYSYLFPETKIYTSGYLFFTDLLMNCFSNIYALEDGLGSYEAEYEYSVKKRRQKILYGSIDDQCYFGYTNKSVGKVYLSNIKPIPECLKYKAEIFNLETLWQSKNKEQKQQINALLLPRTIDMEQIGSRNIILLTQPFSEQFPEISEEYKINMYKTLVAPFDERQLVIKVHPREKTDYRLAFPKAYILDSLFPFELLLLNMPKPFEIAVTIDSTAVGMLNQTKIIRGADRFPLLKSALIRVYGDMYEI